MTRNRLLPIAIAAVALSAITGGILLYRGISAPARLVDRAERDDLLTTDRSIRPHWRSARKLALERIGELPPEATQARLGLITLLCATRYAELEAANGAPLSLPALRITSAEPDPELVASLVAAYLPLIGSDAAGLARTRIDATLDFRSEEAFLRKVWEKLPPEERARLSLNLSSLLGISLTTAEEAEASSSPWYGVPPEVREARQQEMQTLLGMWMIPMLRAAAEGEGIPADETGHFRYLLRAYQLD